MSPAGINQAICTGGMGGWSDRPLVAAKTAECDRQFKIGNWRSNRDISEIHNSALNSVSQSTKSSKESGRVACGLASLALYPQILDVLQQQYSDFFLLWELMQVLGAKTLSFEEILQLLERQGVNTRTCEPRIMQILEGKLPAGVLPDEQDFMLLAEESRQNPDWQAISPPPFL